MIRAEKLTKLYGNSQAVTGVSFQVEKGETMVLLGTSGCGKTTTLKMINRLTEASSGDAWVDGKHIRQQRPDILRRKIGYVLQNTGLFPHYTVAQNIAVVPQLLGWSRSEIRKRSVELLEKLRLDSGRYMDMYPSQLSGGQQQRVGIARALASRPPVLLMDEPFGALDPVTRAGIKADLMTLDELRDKTVILVTHDIQEAFQLGSRICLMKNGRIEQQGSPAELLFRPASDFVTSFFNEQRLLLELQQTTLTSLYPWMNERNDEAHGITEISPESTLWEALTALRNASVPGTILRIKYGHTIKYASADTLMNLSRNYKETIN